MGHEVEWIHLVLVGSGILGTVAAFVLWVVHFLRRNSARLGSVGNILSAVGSPGYAAAADFRFAGVRMCSEAVLWVAGGAPSLWPTFLACSCPLTS